jgi:hypothetical protein
VYAVEIRRALQKRIGEKGFGRVLSPKCKKCVASRFPALSVNALERKPGIPSNLARAVSAIFRTAWSSKLSP